MGQSSQLTHSEHKLNIVVLNPLSLGVVITVQPSLDLLVLITAKRKVT